MNSKILPNEHKEKLNDGTTLTYGNTKDNVVSINVRGYIKPVENKKDYKEESKQLKETTIRKANKVLENTDWIQNHFIFTCDFTERGIIHNKPFRFKYRIYVKPNTREPLNTYRGNILDVATKINQVINTECQEVGFEIIK